MRYTKGLGELITNKLEMGKALGHSIRVSISEQMLNEANSFREKYGISKLADFISAKKKITPPNFDRMISSMEKVKQIKSRGDYLKEKIGFSGITSEESNEYFQKVFLSLSNQTEKENLLFEEQKRFDENHELLRAKNHNEVIQILTQATEAKRLGEKVISKKEVQKVKETPKATETPTTTPAPLVPSPKPSAAPSAPTAAPSVPRAAPARIPPSIKPPARSIIAPVVAGAGLAAAIGTVKSRIAGKESAGISEKSYNLMNLGTGEKSGVDNVFPLTEMTIQKVIDLGVERKNKFKKSGMGAAAGKYQFMPDTLKMYAQKVYGKNWQNVLFSKEVQEKIMDKFTEDNADRLVKAGVPVSDYSLYLMHFTGSVSTTKKLVEAKDDEKMSNILSPAANRANPSISKMTVGEYKTWLKRGNFTFETIQPEKDVGKKMEEMSVDNRNSKKELKTQKDVSPQVIMNQTNTTVVQQSSTTTAPDNTNPLLKR